MSPRRPVIAVAARIGPDDDGTPQAVLGIRTAIARLLSQTGGYPVMVALTDPSAVADGLDFVDALVMPGGGDSDPGLYGQTEHHPRLRLVTREQDDGDVAILRAALARELPVLGICRGMQSLNIALGGDLVQHFDETDVRHHDGTHTIEVCADDSLVEMFVGARRFEGRSIHHQVVGRVADGLRVTARSEDGYVEAVEHESRPVVGLQWHPELSTPTLPQQPGPFRWLVEQARHRR